MTLAAAANSPGVSVEKRLEEDIERAENRYLRASLVTLITSGRLPRAALKDYAVLRWPFQAHADPAMMLSHAGVPAAATTSATCWKTSTTRSFRPKGEGDHPGLWVQFAERLGATREELDEAAANPLAEVIGFPRTMTYFCRRGAPAALATWYADEAQLPEVHGATALALRKFYGLDDETIEYFLEHVRADIGHTDATENPGRASTCAGATTWRGRAARRRSRCGRGARCTRVSCVSYAAVTPSSAGRPRPNGVRPDVRRIQRPPPRAAGDIGHVQPSRPDAGRRCSCSMASPQTPTCGNPWPSA